jgi:ABC-2 type transport system permease protein
MKQQLDDHPLPGIAGRLPVHARADGMSGKMTGLGESLYRVAQLVRKEFRQLSHDPAYAVLLVGLPLMLLLLVVNAVGEGGHSVGNIAVLDQDRTPLSRELVAAIENTGEARVKLWLTRLEDGQAALSSGEVVGLIAIPPGFQRDLSAPQRSTELLAVVDGTNIWMAQSTTLAISGAIGRLAEDLARASGGSAGISLRTTRYFDIEREHDQISSQLGFLACLVVLLVAGMGLAREREMGTLEQLLVTPLNRLELLVGKAMPALLVGMANFWVLWAAARLVWGMPTRGSLGLLFATAILFFMAECAWGLFLSGQAANQQQATQFLFVQILVDLSFCGYIVPVENLPRLLSWFAELLPLRHYLVCINTIMLRGGGLAAVLPHALALIGLNLALWTVSITVLRRSLD